MAGESVWTKLIRHYSVVQYLFNAESYAGLVIYEVLENMSVEFPLMHYLIEQYDPTLDDTSYTLLADFYYELKNREKSLEYLKTLTITKNRCFSSDHPINILPYKLMRAIYIEQGDDDSELTELHIKIKSDSQAETLKVLFKI
ncbi:unnamed protein product [Didymodactylos carnosus]|uniref:Uncharacterized protein n=1 Tax=Didymodactylos carnosus TaxID=1234261 RepID=A0A814NFC6_9BILA|nr:unnamed protein product [Didymodactylos carnosus]CAF3855273.1 unnamed protein product [Didymodactylos carnosus]